MQVSVAQQIITVVYWCSLWVSCMSSEDYYTSQNSLQKLVTFEQEIIQALNDYVVNIENRLLLAKKYLNDYEASVLAPQSLLSSSEEDKKEDRKIVSNKSGEKSAAHEKIGVAINGINNASKLSDTITGHPLMTYRLIRRFAVDLVQFESHLRKDYGKGFLRILEKTRKGQNFPKIDDVNGATQAIIRVQDAYNLDIAEFSKGKFDGVETHSGLTAKDLFYVGSYAFDSNIHTRAIEWLVAAQKLSTIELPPTISTTKVTDKLQAAIRLHNLVQNTMPNNRYVFRDSIESNLSNWKSRQRVLDSQKHELYLTESSMYDLTNFAALCRGETLRSPKAMKNLKCWYDTRNFAFLLNPVKVEMHNADPPIFQYYDILSDSIISGILEKTTSGMARSRVQGIQANKEIISAVRTSTTTWIPEEDFEDIAKLPRLTELITGLNVRSGASEQLQVTSYGIGGHYNPHHDNLYNNEHSSEMNADAIMNGDRIGTVLFYLSKVKAGGGTAFPKLGVLAQPIKGSAIFWYNLKRNGKKDSLALHGGCPILYGKKIVANKWIRANNQITTRACSLDRNE